jgi:hypothetical protein
MSTLTFNSLSTVGNNTMMGRDWPSGFQCTDPKKVGREYRQPIAVSYVNPGSSRFRRQHSGVVDDSSSHQSYSDNEEAVLEEGTSFVQLVETPTDSTTLLLLCTTPSGVRFHSIFRKSTKLQPLCTTPSGTPPRDVHVF